MIWYLLPPHLEFQVHEFVETNWYTALMTERMISPEVGDDDRDEYSLRPKRLREFIGQPKIKESLGVFLTAAQRRGEALDHVLLHGPPGLGKTSLSLIIANEMGAALRATSGPAIERPGDLVAILTNLEPGSVLFLDEIHRLSRPVEEILYSAMEDYQVDIFIVFLHDFASEDIAIEFTNAVPILPRNYNRRMVSKNYRCHGFSFSNALFVNYSPQTDVTLRVWNPTASRLRQ